MKELKQSHNLFIQEHYPHNPKANIQYLKAKIDCIRVTG